MLPSESAKSKRPCMTIKSQPAKSPIWRKDFPILSRKVAGGKALSYLDNGATSQKPMQVIEAIDTYYKRNNANVHRGIHELSEVATAAFEGARSYIAKSVNAKNPEELVFVRGCTEAINLVAQAFLRPRLNPGDEIIVTILEHHANIVPWQMVAQEKGAKIRVVMVDEAGSIDIDSYENMLSSKTKMVAFSHISNVLGTVLPVKRMVKKAHAYGVPVLVDGAQSTPHMSIDVSDIGADFYTFSSHKAFGPTGIGVLYGQYHHLETMPPYQSGGGMIERVSFSQPTTFTKAPWRFEAGTPNIAGAIGFAESFRYIHSIGYEAIHAHEQYLNSYMHDMLDQYKQIKVFGSTKDKAAIASFSIEGIHAHDIATILNSEGVAVRAGHHCTMPLMEYLGLSATTRASLAMYNNTDDIDALARGLDKVLEVFHG